jgi:hypothetical protein
MLSLGDHKSGETKNALDALGEEHGESDGEVSTPTNQHGQPAMASLSASDDTAEIQELMAIRTALQKRIHAAETASLQEQIAVLTARAEAAERQHAMGSSGPLSSTPVTAIHQPVNRHLFPSTARHIAGIHTPMSAIALAKKQSYAGLAPAAPVIDPPEPALPSSSLPVRRNYKPPVKFTGDKDTQNAAVEQWLVEVNKYMSLTRVPLDEQLDDATYLLSGYALKWYGRKTEELNGEGLAMTWEWIQRELIKDFGRSTGQVAERAQWAVLVMGSKNADGTQTGGKATYTVKDYTDLFTGFMESLTVHTTLTEDILYIDRYVKGIEIGYPALWEEMKAQSKQSYGPVYETLAVAITAAELAESALAVSKIHHSSASSSHHHRAHQTRVNHMQSTLDDSPSPPRSPVSKRRVKKKPTSSTSTLTANGFVYKPVIEEGRYRLSEPQMRSLYDEGRCYHCYQPRHTKMNLCPKKMPTAPQPLN